MVVQKSLSGKVLVMSGGSRGIGLAIGLRAAQDGAKVAIIAKTEEPHPKLEGTIHSAAEEIRAAGGQALPIAGDVRDDERVLAAVQQVVDQFGGIAVELVWVALQVFGPQGEACPPGQGPVLGDHVQLGVVEE